MSDGFTITNGTAEFEHKNPYTEYGFKAPKVSLSFTIAEGSDAAVVTAKVMGIAVEIVERANHAQITFQAQRSGPEQRDERLAAQAPVLDVPPTPAPAATRTRRTKAKIEADEAAKKAAAGGVASSDQASAADLGLASSDPSNSSEPEPTSEVTAADLGIPAPEPEENPAISDKELGAFANRISGPVQKEHGNLNVLRDLINKFTVEGTPGYGHLMQIEPAKRAEFVAEAKKLVKADVGA